MDGEKRLLTPVKTPLGWAASVERPDGTLLGFFLPEENKTDVINRAYSVFGHHITIAIFRDMSTDVAEYFDEKKQVTFNDLEIDLSHQSPMTARILGSIRKIPYGQTRKFAEIAELIWAPGGDEATKIALIENPLPLIIPAHRVILPDTFPHADIPGEPDLNAKLRELEQRVIKFARR